MELGLAGRVALVTGGTKGIGRATVECLADEGCRIALCSRTAADVERAVAELGDRGVEVFGRAVDVRDHDALRSFTVEAADAFGGLDVLVANAGAMSLDDWYADFETDLMGTVRLVEAAMPYLEASSIASIVAISSVSARWLDWSAGPYGAMKVALLHYVQGLANELAPKGIRANAVSPGDVYFPDGVWGDTERDDPDLFAAEMTAIPMGRMARGEELARPIVFMASPAASYVTGTNLIVDGGLTHDLHI